ncbi:MAG: Eco57I restriction-modification methylase domain-containing protein [Kiritimatiellae bacterium]|nr:Eco57I restriction-modification methylase domain-containing protein [Kiritimatiellia bacterium]
MPDEKRLPDPTVAGLVPPEADTFAPTFSAKTIYVYNSTDAGHEGLVKIGDATVKGLASFEGVEPDSPELNAAARRRIDAYTGTHGANCNLLRTELAVRKLENGKWQGFRDHHVHRVLANSGIEQVRPNGSNAREWFKTDLATSENAIAAVKENRKTLSAGEITEDRTPFVPRPEQERFIQETIKAFKKQNRYLWNAKMRFGKTVTALELVRRMGFAKTIIVTHRPVVNAGWFDDFRNKVFVRPGDVDWVYGTKDSGAAIDELCEGGKKHLVYFASIQDLRESRTIGGRFDKNADIFAAHWDCVIVDEAHEGTQTALGDKVVKALFPDEKGSTAKLLALSGTPFNILDAYRDSGVSTWDYVMEQAAKQDWERVHGDDANPYADLPRLSMFVYDLDAEIGGYKAEDVRGSVFNFKEFFRVWTGDAQLDHGIAPEGIVGRFVHEADVRRFLALLADPSKSTRFPFATEENRAMFRHTFWLVPGVKEARALQPLVEECFPGIKVVNVAGDGDPEDPAGEALGAVRDAIATHECTITLSCGKLTTGVTVPEWTAVLMLAGRYETSAIRYLQTVFRVQSPGELDGRVKENCYVYDFAPDRTLKVLADAARLSDTNRRSGGDDSDRRAAMGELLNFCPVIALEGSAMRPFDADSLMQHLKRALAARAILSGFSDDSIYDDDALRLDRIDLDDFKELHSRLKKAKVDYAQADGVYAVNRHGLTEEEREKAKRAAKKPPRELSAEERELLRRLREEREAKKSFKATLRAVSVRLPLMLYGAEGSFDADISLDSFIAGVDSESWKEFMPRGVDKAFFSRFKKYYDKDIFATAAKTIRRRAQDLDDRFPEERIAAIAEIFAVLRNPDKETVLTPWRVVNMHLASTLGGWCFHDGEYARPLATPRCVEGTLFADPAARILEINSKTGLYPLYAAYSLYRARLADAPVPATPAEANAVWDAVCRENVFVLCRTAMAAAITRRTLVGFRNAETRIIAMPDIIEKLKKDPAKVARKLRKPATWGVGAPLSFDAVVGNPPYQLEVAKRQSETNGQARRKSIFQLFQLVADAVSSGFTSLIYPGGRWLQRSGKGMEEFGLSQINDPKLVRVDFYPDSSEVFPSVAIADGLSIVFKDVRKTASGFQYVYHKGGKAQSRVWENPGKVLIPLNPSDGEIVDKVRNFCHREKLKCLAPSILSQKFFGIESDFAESNPLLVKPYDGEELDYSKEIKLFTNDKAGKAGRARWYVVNRHVIKAHNTAIDKWKVVVSSANAGGQKRDWQLEVLDNHSAFGRSRVALGLFDTRMEAENFCNYCKTYLIRFMFLMTDEALTTLAKEVPALADYKSANSLLDFSSDLNPQLYRLVGLSAPEIAHVETTIRTLDASRNGRSNP